MSLKNILQKGFSILLLNVVLYSCTEDLPQVPANQNNWKVAVQTDSLGNVNGSSAVITGIVGEVNANQIVSRGFCWDTLPNPTIEKGKIEIGTGVGLFNDTIKDLLPEKLYYVRAFAKTNYMSFYGDEKSFTTLDGLAKLDTLTISDITQTSAIANIKLIDDGGFPVTSMGVCWSKTNPPKISDSKLLASSIQGEVTCKIDQVEYNTSYYLRAFATNERGTAYGPIDSILTNPGLPKVETDGFVFNNLVLSRIDVYGNLITDGGSPIIKIGFCWSESTNPTLDDFIIIGSQNLSSISGVINGLKLNTKYYYRIYATNKFGTSYGIVKSFTSTSGLANAYTHDAKYVTKNSAILKGAYDNLSIGQVLEFGFCWSKKAEPSIDDYKKIVASDGREFETTIEDLEENTHYYIRSYVNTNYGTAYGKEVRIFTNNLPQIPLEFITIEGGEYIMGTEDGLEGSIAHNVKISSFQMSSKEVTCNQFIEFLKANPPNEGSYFYTVPGLINSVAYWEDHAGSGIGYYNASEFFFKSSDITSSPYCPAAAITYWGARAYCEWVGGRLPTEAEWEFAAKGGNLGHGYIYSGSDNLDEVAWHAGNCDSILHEGGLKKANELGLFDLTGNVLEICNDWYDVNYYFQSPYVDPQGPNSSSQDLKVARGGSWLSKDIESLTITKRYMKAARYSNIGFRVVKDL